MEINSGEENSIRQNPKLALLQRIRQQKEQNVNIPNETTPNSSEKARPKQQLESDTAYRKINKKKSSVRQFKVQTDISSEIPNSTEAFLDEYEKSIKIFVAAKASHQNGTLGVSESFDEDELIPAAISISDIKMYIDNLCKPAGLITLYQKENYLKHRLLLITDISKSLSRNLLTGRHMYSIGMSGLMPKTKCDIYETTLHLIDEFRLSHEKQTIRSILLDFLTFFTNVLTSKDIGMTTYVIEQSSKTGVLERLLELCTGWTLKEAKHSTKSAFTQSYPTHVTLGIEEYLKDKEDQLTATWRPFNEEEKIRHTLPLLESCLRSSVRFDGTYPIRLYEVSVSDYSVAGVQSNSEEGQIKPLATALAGKFPSHFDKYRSFSKEEEKQSVLDTQNIDNTGKGLISFHRVFSTGYALVSLGMKRGKYLGQLDTISESIAEVLIDSSNTDFGTLSMYIQTGQDLDSEDEDIDLPDLESLNINEGKSASPKSDGLIKKKPYSNINMFIVMTEDLWFDSNNVENKQNVPKYLAQIDYLRALMLKPKDINDTYRGLNTHRKTKNSCDQWAYVYLVDVGLTARVKVTSLLVIKNNPILSREPLLSFVKIKGLDPSIDLEVADACARVIYHIVDDPDSQRHMVKYVITGESTTKTPNISSWRRLLVEKDHKLGLQALSIKAFRCISQEHHDKNCNIVDEMPVNDSEFHTDMCKYIAEFLCSLLFIETFGSQYENCTHERSISDAMYTLYYTMDIMPEARLKRTFEETKVRVAIQKMLDPNSIMVNEKEQNLSDLVLLHENAPKARHLDDMVVSLAEKLNGFDIVGNALMRRLTNQRLTSNYPQGSRRTPIRSSNNMNDAGNRFSSFGRGHLHRGNFGASGGKRRPPPTESEGGPINTGGGIVPNSRSQAHQVAIKAGIHGFNQPVYRSKADIDPEVRHCTVGQSGVTSKAIAHRSSEDKYLEQLENADGDSSMLIKLKEKTPIVDRAKELEARWQQEEDPIAYESLITYADIADFAAPENVVALPDMKSSRRLKQEVVALLNENRGGQILMGVDERSNGGAGLVSGVFLNRWLKDKFRQEMDGIPKQIAPDPLPDRRIGQPVFIPVLHNPRASNRNGESPYVIRIAIRPKLKEQSPKEGGGDSATENQIYYKLRDEPNPMIRLNGKTVEGIYLNIQKKILQGQD